MCLHQTKVIVITLNKYSKSDQVKLMTSNNISYVQTIILDTLLHVLSIIILFNIFTIVYFTLKLKCLIIITITVCVTQNKFDNRLTIVNNVLTVNTYFIACKCNAARTQIINNLSMTICKKIIWKRAQILIFHFSKTNIIVVLKIFLNNWTQRKNIIIYNQKNQTVLGHWKKNFNANISILNQIKYAFHFF